MTRLETAHLVLRPFALADAPFIVRLLNDPDFIANIADKGVRTVEAAETYLREGPLASYATHGHGLWMVEDRDTGAPMGMCGLIRRESLPQVDLGYAFLPEFRGRGFAREAASACVDHARAAMGLPGLLAIVSPGNAASVRLLESLGFARESIMELTPGDPVVLFKKDL